ncbi:MAG TPA: endonuclease/exonuclease/phosphatase family protein [Alphaproteobacteria bacterium]|jgi:endonuclease/exonuclease/phosphatase family metal-dependent hydrolase|nr:endonuclease/exonuclease/phosphatase family protein [Alphaproteobacteria bacterium]
MKIASYNLENLFERAKALNQDAWASSGGNASPWSDGKDLLANYAALNTVLSKTTYTAADRNNIVDLLGKLGLKKSDESDYVILRQNRGHLLKRPRGKPVEVVATGRDDWIGWLELKREAVDEVATQNTGRVIKTIDADVLAVVEAESRTALCRFNDQVLAGAAVAGTAYEHVMLIDGNDERGIDVGLFTKAAYPIVSMCSHVDDRDGSGNRIFSRDCALYAIALPGGGRLTLLVNHFKSKGYGGQAQSDAKRAAQAARVRAIYDTLRAAGTEQIAVVGDFNDTADRPPLAALVANGTDLKDISAHPSFNDGGRPGTFGNGTKANKIDYILLSPALFARVTGGGIFRDGVWGGKNGTLFPHLPTITKASEAASDHAAIWAELAL